MSHHLEFNADSLPHYCGRYRAGQRISTGFVESGYRRDEHAGLLIGDVVLAIDGKVVTDTSNLQATLDPESVGKTSRVQILRGGRPAEVHVTNWRATTERVMTRMNPMVFASISLGEELAEVAE